MTSQQREEQAPEIGDQIERGHDGYVANSCEIGARRNLRKLCGRQALLDLLARAERERQRELQYLLECRPVSEFAHRNRIQVTCFQKACMFDFYFYTNSSLLYLSLFLVLSTEPSLHPYLKHD